MTFYWLDNYKNSYLTTIHGLGPLYPILLVTYITIFYSNPYV